MIIHKSPIVFILLFMCYAVKTFEILIIYSTEMYFAFLLQIFKKDFISYKDLITFGGDY